MHKMLTPDQQLEFDKMMKEREHTSRKTAAAVPAGFKI